MGSTIVVTPRELAAASQRIALCPSRVSDTDRWPEASWVAVTGAGYGPGMPAARRPAPDDAEKARHILLAGLARDTAISDLLTEIEPLHPRHDTFPGEVFLRLAADALAWAAASRAEPLPLEGTRERFLPEFSRRGRDRRKLQYAVLAAAALHGGTEPDLAGEVTWWQADDFWQYALLAAILCIRAAADRAGLPVTQACQELAERRGQQPG
jgi:hypothetical protein